MENGTKVKERIVQQSETLDVESSNWITYEFSDMAKIIALEIFFMEKSAPYEPWKDST